MSTFRSFWVGERGVVGLSLAVFSTTACASALAMDETIPNPAAGKASDHQTFRGLLPALT
jgi:hypothetical protein